MCARLSSFFFISFCCFASLSSLSFIICSALRCCFLSFLSCSCSTWVSWLCCAVSSSTVFSSFVLCCIRAWTCIVIKRMHFRTGEKYCNIKKILKSSQFSQYTEERAKGEEELIFKTTAIEGGLACLSVRFSVLRESFSFWSSKIRLFKCLISSSWLASFFEFPFLGVLFSLLVMADRDWRFDGCGVRGTAPNPT